MKKKRILGLAALVFSAAGLVACGGGDGPAASSQGAHKHAYTIEVSVEDATCEKEGKRVMKCECGETQEKKINKKSHTYVEVAAKSVAATCTAAGKKVSECSVCHVEKTDDIEALGHEYVKKTDQTGAVAPTCTVAGTEKQECSRCHEAHDAEVKALGHEWVDDANQAAAEQPACTFSGEVLQHCSHEGCTETRKQRVTATGHTFGTPTTVAKAGDFVGYTKEYCAKDQVTRVSWAATDVTTRCATPSVAHVVTSGTTADGDAVWEDKTEPHIVETDDDGVQFWGRAIGNAQILDDTGSASQNSHVHEPNENIEGSFFEYKFKNTEALESVRLIANLKPANYLSRNDIWRASGAENDWTPGYQKGTDGQMHIVNDWRYVMFIDGTQIQLDRTVDTKLINANSADWYTVPMKTMNLAAGEHTIKVVMAGGYRHTFYKFGFETGIQHEHDVVVGEKSTRSALHEITCKCNKLAGYQLLAAEASVGQLTPAATGQTTADKDTRLGKNNIFDDKWDISGISAGMYEVYLEARASQNNASSGKWKGDGSNVSSNGGTAELASDYKYKIAAHGELEEGAEPNYIGLGAVETYASTGIEENAAKWTNKALATIPVNTGDTTLTIHNMNNGYSIWIYSVRLVKVSDFVY